MSLESKLVYPGNGFEQWTSVAVHTCGQIVATPTGRAGVIQGLQTSAIGDEVSAATEGQFDVSSASATTFAVGDAVYWDDSAGVAVGVGVAFDGDSDLYLGVATRAKTSGQLVVQVALNVGWQQVMPFVYEFDCETGVDTAVHTLIPARMNKRGLHILSIHGLVTEQFAGTEDQGIITIKNTASSPATLATLTAADSGADAVNDVIQAAGAANAIYSASGVATLNVAAGLGITGQVTQVTTGSAAGKMKVFVLTMPLA